MKKNKPNRGVGRPMADVKIPRGRFTFAEFMAFNASANDGNGWKPLTLRNFLKRDAARKGKSIVVLTGKFEKPENGIGRPSAIMAKRIVKKTNTLAVARKSKVSVNVAAAAAAILAEPTPVTPAVAPATPEVAAPATA